MIYTVFAIIICVAITGTVCIDPTTGTTTRKTLHLEPYSYFGYDCKGSADYIKSIDGKLFTCLRNGWNLTMDDLRNCSAKYCCREYELHRGVKTLVHKHCRKDEGKPDTSDKSLISICVTKKGHQLSDSFCNGLSVRLPMGADCDHIVDSLAKGIDPFPTPSVSVRPPQHSGPNQSSTARPNPQSTAVSVSLAAIMVSIVVDVYGF
ncbi:unnamed protein product [Medioppia subpectinata]|uniref:Uncharacterized protein n=1 Tax=Medioppia subpectinata TaxID=1979941 RepID=A0A7R9KNP4_9ACAR|nr:unnamed protein product [Medioppia subpectinata]CAG2105789.1 unnamed protein product [Medioppia subpectinata]